MGDPKTRRQAEASARRGRSAEEAAASFLEDAGYEILGRNLRVGRLEIDLLVRQGEVVAVVEVRTRGAGAWERALDSVHHDKRRRVRSAGEAIWRRRFAKDASVQRMRFDLVGVTLDEVGRVTSVEHVRAAF